jgi:hypothetical protein
MKPLSKILTCTLILAMIGSALTSAESARAQTFTHSEPEFTVKYVVNSYTVPPVYETDPYTGNQKVVQYSQYVENKTVYVLIKNQPFTSFTVDDNHTALLYYNIMWKGHFEDYWHTYYNYAQKLEIYSQDNEKAYTEIPILTGGSIPGKGEIDFKLQVLVGYIKYTHDVDPENYHLLSDITGYYDRYSFFGNEYNGTIIQTLSIPDGSVTYSAIPTQTQTSNNTPIQSSVPTTNPSDSNLQGAAAPADNSVANGTADTFSLGELKVSMGTLVVLIVVSVLLSSLAMLGLTRRTKKRID